MEEIVESGMEISDTAAGNVVETDNAEAVGAGVKGGENGSREAEKSLVEGEETEKGSVEGEETEKSLLEVERTEKSLLEREIVRLKEEAARQKEEFEAAIGEMKVKGAVLEKLYGVGAKNPKLLMRLIDVSKVGFDEDGGIVGLDEQIGGLKENEGYLFEERRFADSFGCFRPEESGDLAETRADFSQMTYSEMIRALGR